MVKFVVFLFIGICSGRLWLVYSSCILIWCSEVENGVLCVLISEMNILLLM